MATTKQKFQMEMTCEGCSNAAKRVLAKIGVTDVEADLKAQILVVNSAKSPDELKQTLEKTGKKVEYLGEV